MTGTGVMDQLAAWIACEQPTLVAPLSRREHNNCGIDDLNSVSNCFSNLPARKGHSLELDIAAVKQ